MKLIGLDLGKNRTPFRNMTDEEEAAMKAELEAINFFERCNKFYGMAAFDNLSNPINFMMRFPPTILPR